MVIINTQGIVLKSVPYKENDLILTVFSRKLGKIAVIARGAKKSKSSLLSSSQIFSYSNFTLKKEGHMYRVTQSEIIKSFYNLSYNFEAFSYGTYILKLIDNFLSVIGVEDSMGKVVKSTIVIYDDFKNILIAERGKGKNTPKQWGLFGKELKGKETAERAL